MSEDLYNTDIEGLTSDEWIRLRRESEAREAEGIERSIAEEEAKEASKRNITIDFEPGYYGPTVSGIVSHSEEEREIWVFRYDERSHSLKPRAYRIEARETTRHRWKIVKAWGSAESRMYRLETCPPVPPDVLSLVMAGFIEELKIEGVPNEDRRI